MTVNNVGHSNSSKQNWYSPQELMERVRYTLNGIDLDPTSCAEANTLVQAKRYFTKEDDALTQNWSARSVWLNPPYSRNDTKLKNELTRKFIEGYQSEVFEYGMYVSNSSQETEQHQSLMKAATLVIFPSFRIGFIDGDTMVQQKGNQKPQVLYLLSDCPNVINRCYETFSEIGTILYTDNAIKLMKS